MKMVLTMILATFAAMGWAQEVRSASERGAEGYMLFVRDSLPDDREKGYAIMLEAAWEGDAKSANNVGWLALTGEYGEQDKKSALRWFERAADQGLPVGALNYIELLESGSLPEGTPLPDPQRMSRAAMLAGSALAMGRGLPYDYRRGERLMVMAALMGDASAAMAIAQQLEMYPDSFSYLPLAEIAAKCDSLLPPAMRNLTDSDDITAFTERMLTPEFWYARAGNNTKNP